MTFLHKIPWSPGNEDPATRTPATAEQFNAAALWKRETIAELSAMETTLLPQYANDCPVYCLVSEAGLYRYAPSGAATVDGYSVVDANGPGQWILVLFQTGYNSDFTEEALSGFLMGLQETNERILTFEIRQELIEYTFVFYRAAVSVAAASIGTAEFDCFESGVLFDIGNCSISIHPPDGYNGSPLMGQPFIRRANLIVAAFVNPTAGALNIPAGKWVIKIIQRNQ